MNTCKTCKYWIGDKQEPYDGVFWECLCPKIDTSGCLEDPDSDGAQAGGSDGWGNYFKVGPDFGCIHHAVEN